MHGLLGESSQRLRVQVTRAARRCPELSKLKGAYVHAPWDAPATARAAAGVVLGRTYPRPVVRDLEAALKRSLRAVNDVREGAGAEFVLPDGNEARALRDVGVHSAVFPALRLAWKGALASCDACPTFSRRRTQMLVLPDGRKARLITRVDFRVGAQDPLTRQTAAAEWDPRRRTIGEDAMARALREEIALSERDEGGL